MSPVNIEVEKQKIKEAYDFWIKNEIKGDIETCMKVISEEAVFLPPGLSPVKGGKDLRVLGKEATKHFVGGKWDVGYIEVATSGDLAVNVATWWPKIETPDGVVEQEGSAINVWKKIDSEWKCVYSCWNSNVS